jgi:hypothetical protein
MGEYERYKPGIVPSKVEDLPRYLDDELNRIAALTEQQLDEAIVILDATETVTLEPIAGWEQVFTIATPVIAVPASSWSAGTFTAPYTGFYKTSITGVSDAPLGAGNKDWTLGVAIVLNGTDRKEAFQSASDNRPITLSIAITVPMDAGDTLWFEGDAVHEDRTDIVTINLFAEIKREY